MEQLTFASYRSGKQGVRVVGMAQGQFAMATVLKKMRLQKVKPIKVRNSDIYPMPAGMQMTFLDDNTLLFGDSGALRGALDARDGYSYTLDSNADDRGHDRRGRSGTVWSVLDQQGTQNMLRSALGDAAGLADYDTVKKRIPGFALHHELSQWREFRPGCHDVGFDDRDHLSSLVKAGMLYKKDVGHADREGGDGHRDRRFRQLESADAFQELTTSSSRG